MASEQEGSACGLALADPSSAAVHVAAASFLVQPVEAVSGGFSQIGTRSIALRDPAVRTDAAWPGDARVGLGLRRRASQNYHRYKYMFHLLYFSPVGRHSGKLELFIRTQSNASEDAYSTENNSQYRQFPNPLNTDFSESNIEFPLVVTVIFVVLAKLSPFFLDALKCILQYCLHTFLRTDNANMPESQGFATETRL
ncbi:hypothetical protein LAV84_22875 [Rhizobium sp. VS19-DR104.2]|uniref:hypothetical protein n=1 Tax=unclassified Rhizobium TaxID=2613769 RepID=UPI001CC3D50B|nr:MULTISPECIES: hypothetical protein [unclassified Rhizobium]MBZ5761924.1 hypothetical protein [Rhizobium sp. VS19-DR96]MBZ5768897.1 hypothetical protein [Rhizobium sp. VS19-DR129.2]MBZ5775699.1 hypothetical protein [Rhizobium sp. VS19-DRK62.2]MBZ5786803.1 hypothetical protein [Rhizobium sp. VS19-DR121]MBZ5805013.1 hypothetical protein [Rhizobium sp. VS19-DR181]